MPGAGFIFDFFPQPGDRMWTPADWAWIGGLMDAMMPALAGGVPPVAHPQGKFDSERAFDLVSRFGLRNAFMPPPALKILRHVPNPRGVWTLPPPSVLSENGRAFVKARVVPNV